MIRSRIRDGKKSGSGINIPDPQHWIGLFTLLSYLHCTALGRDAPWRWNRWQQCDSLRDFFLMLQLIFPLPSYRYLLKSECVYCLHTFWAIPNLLSDRWWTSSGMTTSALPSTLSRGTMMHRSLSRKLQTIGSTVLVYPVVFLHPSLPFRFFLQWYNLL